MPAPREVRWTRKFLNLCGACFVLSAVLFAQTSIDDVHIRTRGAGSAPPISLSSIGQMTNGMLPVIRTDTSLVLVPVTVTDSMERFVTGLKQDNFQLFEDKKPQTIQHFSTEELPVSIGLIVDTSGSMGDKVARVQEAIRQFCDASNPQDEFFLITFSDAPRLASDFASSTEVEKELFFSQAKGRTSLLDAIYMGLRKMKDAKHAKKALLIISDGGDNHSRYSEREVRSIAKESDVAIYSIGTFDRYVTTIEESLGPELLTAIADPTGGRAYILDNASQMPAVARHIGLELRTQYVLAYRPQQRPRDGRWRKIRVRLRLPKRLSFLQAHARTGYYASE